MDIPSPIPRPWDLTRVVLGVLTIGGLALASFWVLRPFLLAGIWATMIVVSTWPTLRAVQARLWGKRSLAVVIMTVVMLVIIAAPLATAVIGVAERSDDIVTWSRSFITYVLAGPPEWVARLPLLGGKLAERWQAIAVASSEELTTQAAPYVRDVARWVLGQVGTVGTLLIEILLTVIIAIILYANGEAAAAGVVAFARRLSGPAGERAAVLSARAIRAVALGIVVTALVQSVIGGIGLAITGVPYPLLLSSVMFLLGIAQIGPFPVLLGAVIWAYWANGTFWGTLMLLCALVTGSLDNVLRPILI
ncbi:MAG TPA: AI-2E family transporter, partial [Methylomirabilota bacterium]|nr:AI-2E family transporter [Methylomirabilota bacterium]